MGRPRGADNRVVDGVLFEGEARCGVAGPARGGASRGPPARNGRGCPLPVMGTYSRTIRLRFSLLPRSQGECGWAKNTGNPVAVTSWRRAMSEPQSHVNDRRIVAGRSPTAAMIAWVTVSESRPVSGTRITEPAGALDQRRHRGFACLADHQIPFPVTGHGAALHLVRAVVDVVGLPDSRGGCRARAGPPGVAGAQRDQLPAQRRNRLRVDPLIARLMTHPARVPGRWSRANQPAIKAGDQPRRNNDHTRDLVRVDRSTAIPFGRHHPTLAAMSAATARYPSLPP